MIANKIFYFEKNETPQIYVIVYSFCFYDVTISLINQFDSNYTYFVLLVTDTLVNFK